MRTARVHISALILAVRALGARCVGWPPSARPAGSLARIPQDHSLALIAAGIAHDLNNLLTVITATSQMAAADVSDLASSRRWLEVLEASQMAAELTRQLAALGRQTMLPLRPVSPNSVITGGLDLLTRLAGEEIAMRTSLAADAGSILIDPAELLRVLMNLVLNARDAMPSGGTLTIETRMHTQAASASGTGALPPGRYVMLKVIDTGKGMDEATMSRAFQPFFSTKSFDRGSGLGLEIVAAIVRQSGGHLSVKSGADAGTAFHLFFPAAKPRSDRTQI